MTVEAIVLLIMAIGGTVISWLMKLTIDRATKAYDKLTEQVKATELQLQEKLDKESRRLFNHFKDSEERNERAYRSLGDAIRIHESHVADLSNRSTANQEKIAAQETRINMLTDRIFKPHTNDNAR